MPLERTVIVHAAWPEKTWQIDEYPDKTAKNFHVSKDLERVITDCIVVFFGKVHVQYELQ